MINICLEGHEFKNELFDIARLFYFDSEITFISVPREDFRGIFILSKISRNNDSFILQTKLSDNNAGWSEESEVILSQCEDDAANQKKAVKREVKRQAYILLSKLHGRNMPWGMLTGIRPAKLVSEMLQEGFDKERASRKLREYYMVSEGKTELACNVAEVEKDYLEKTAPDMISIYVGIPFCPTRCLYCSFTSSPIKKYEKYVDRYLQALFEEMKLTGKMIEEKNYRIQSIYIGGGTPTSLSAKELEALLKQMETAFDYKDLAEFTLEAGRPDSITFDKLEVIKNSRVDRISINPQSMNEDTLKLIGRNHTPGDIVNCFRSAREMGFDNINMDVIAGLPGENPGMFENTMKEIKALGPDSLTVHTMSIKRASRLKEEKYKYDLKAAEEVEAMITVAQGYARECGMRPYYLYRQKNILGNLENVGYSKPGRESIYNIQIMEEKQTILALGAGAITKVVYPSQNRLERAFNVKSVEEYVNRLDEMIERKRLLLY